MSQKILSSLFAQKSWANRELFDVVASITSTEHAASLHTAIRTLNHVYVDKSDQPCSEATRAALEDILNQRFGVDLPHMAGVTLPAQHVELWLGLGINGLKQMALAYVPRKATCGGSRCS